MLMKAICKWLPNFNKAPSCAAGIVQGKGCVQQVKKQNGFSTIQVQFPAGKTDAIQTGASVAINGTCLTVSCASLCCITVSATGSHQQSAVVAV